MFNKTPPGSGSGGRLRCYDKGLICVKISSLQEESLQARAGGPHYIWAGEGRRGRHCIYWALRYWAAGHYLQRVWIL